MESSNPNPNSNPNQNPNPNPNPSTFFFSPSTVRNLPSQDKLPQEFLARYSPDFQYVEALLSSQSPDHQYLDKIFQGSPNKQLSPPKGLDPQYDQPNKQYNNDYYEPEEYDENAPFTTEFPRAKDYLNFQSLLETFPHLQNLNDPFFDIEAVSPDAHFYIMRSSNDDNIHKAIKYHIWTTTTSGKNVLSRAWREFKDKGRDPEVFLIFSVVNSNQFLGIAKLDSDIVHNETFKYWWEPCKWFGVFHIKWLFVKDIHHAKFEHLKQEVYQHVEHNNMKTPTLCSVINLRDSTKINAKNGKQILTIFAKHPMKPNIFDSFAYMDRREDQLRAQRDSDPNFNKVWEEYIAAYQLHPDLFRPQTNQPHYYKKDFKKNNQHNSNEYYQQNNYYKGPKQYHHHHNQNQNTGGNQQSNNPQYSQESYEGGGGNYRGNRRGGRGNNSRGRGYAGRGGRGGTGGGRGPRFYANKEDKGQGTETGQGNYQNYEKNDQWQQYNKGFYEGEKK